MSAAILPSCDRAMTLARAPAGEGATTAADTAHPRLVLATTVLASSLAFVDGSVVNVGLPALARSFLAQPLGLSWIVSGYLLPLSALLLASAILVAQGALLQPLSREFGWSVDQISRALALRFALFGLMGPFSSLLIERFGLRNIAATALVLSAVVANRWFERRRGLVRGPLTASTATDFAVRRRRTQRRPGRLGAGDDGRLRSDWHHAVGLAVRSLRQPLAAVLVLLPARLVTVVAALGRFHPVRAVAVRRVLRA